MWQKDKKDSGIVNLALFLALATTPIATNLLVSAPILAQSEADIPAFPLPKTVENGTTVRVDGSTTLAAVNQSLKQGFEEQFAGTKVEVANSGTEAALKALLAGKIDVAAIGRGLTPEEKAQGLEQVRLHREKIAIIVGEENSFKGSLTDRQFARIFRGRITNWSQLGGSNTKIRVIDRPSESDTRKALNNYPVFKAAKFATGSTATQVTEDNTAEIVKQLGKDGISYARANQISKLPGVRVLQLHDTSPTDPKYPFSQPLVYVVNKNPSPGVAAFVGYALASPGQKAIETARVAEAVAIAKGEEQIFLTANNLTSTPGTTPAATTTPIVGSTPTTVPFTTPADNGFPNAETANANVNQPAVATSPETPMGRNLLWWLLLPLAAIAGSLVWWLRRPSASKVTNDQPEPTPQDDGDQLTLPPVAELPLVEIHNHTTPNSTVADGDHLAIADKEIDHQVPATTNNLGNYPVAIPPELEQSPWDMEAPAAVVNTSYPQLRDVSVPPTHLEVPTEDIPELPDIPELTTSNREQLTVLQPPFPEDLPDTTTAVTDIWSTTEELANSNPEEPTTELTPVVDEEVSEDLDSFPDMPDIYQIFADEGEVTQEETISPTAETISWPESAEEPPTNSTFAEIPEDALNLVADAAELGESETLEETEFLTPSSLGTLAGGAALAGAGVATWNVVSSIEETETLPVPVVSDTPEENLPTVVAETADLPDEEEESSIVLRPRSPEWAYVSWYISPSDRQKLEDAGSPELALHLYDVTELDLSYQTPHQVQQYECEPATTDRYIPIPASEHDYMMEVGYLSNNETWETIARSLTVRVFNRPYTESLSAELPTTDAASIVVFTPRTPKWAYVNWEIADTHKQILKDKGIAQLALRLYDVTNVDLSYQHPQLVQQYEFEEITSDRYVSIPQSERDYMTEIGYQTTGDRWVTIARSASARVFNSPHGDFWFVADTELMIHGATEPGAKVMIAGKPITLKSDGTFHLRIPFSEKVIEYLISVASEGQTKSIHKKFFQETSEGDRG
ncbi:DUF4912 domain-containing protein [Nostoc sp. TCL26-01]|uniref:DUF4912 domain-containing protein n=1 Tax=Nostoc sp. TCL26-01 TaxID=2576904 RepID=UPI0015B7EB91|nr:DUF4912 domain-containing protein [Nostoc sp. TCL26-01]QLE57808.1 DUF4912 domain-containing protein [Nostoc sp. TCL26-01]